MLKRRNISLVAIAILAVVLTIVFWPRAVEPSYRGKPVSHWVSVYNHGVTPEELNELPHAFRAMGQDALPYLLEIAGYTEPEWKDKLRFLYNRSVGALNHSWFWNDGNNWKNSAELPFVLLPEEAQTLAFDSLQQLLIRAESESQGRRVAEAMTSVGPPIIPWLTPLVTNESALTRSWAVLALGTMGNEVRSHAPLLRSALADPDRDVQAAAKWALAEIESDGKNTVE